jgi:Cellulase (glycosyl hydrolase family 5)
MIARTLKTLMLMLVLGLAAAAPGNADRGAEVGIEDGAVLLAPSPDAGAVVARWRAIGVDWVRIQAFRDAISPSTTATKAPKGFRIDNPNDPRYRWAQLDNAIDLVRANGMRVMLTVHQKGPVWASQVPSRHNGAFKPDPKKFGQFAAAVAKRYSSRVDRYLIGNEPNQKAFLAPQTQCRAGRCDRTGPSMYRDLVNAAYPQIKRFDRSAQAIVGELAPIGAAGPHAASLAPLPFMRGMACVDDRYRRVTTGSCQRFRALRGDGFGYHPYQVKARPDQTTPNKNLAKLGDLGRFFRAMDKLTRAHRMRAPGNRFGLYLTEYGYETNPPDARFGVTPDQQRDYLAQSAYIVWKTPRLKLITQYLWRDDKLTIHGRLAGFQSGLLYADNTPKPSLAAFPSPFFIDTKRGAARARLWGQVRPDAGHVVQVLVRAPRAASFTPFASNVSTDARGYWSLVKAVSRGANYKFTYTAADGSTATSSAFHVA